MGNVTMYDHLIKGANIVDGTGGEPFIGDIAIQDGTIVVVGEVDGKARETIDAQGAHATPGWIDIHTHFDGQVCWDDTLDPSFSNGVTSIVMGNCGVGFAPCIPGKEMQLVELMEGVEDIPGTALYEGIEWGNWESFPEYINYLATRRFTMDIGTQVPHSALRFYVMGERALRHENATAEDLEAMCAIVKESIGAGALGFSTSRTVGHQSATGEPIPGTFAEKAELVEIVKAMGKGVFQAVPAGLGGDHVPGEKWTMEQDVELYGEISRASGRPCTFTMVQNQTQPDLWSKCLKIVERFNAEGVSLTPQTATRAIGIVSSLRSYHMFMRRPTYMKLEKLPFPQMLAEIRKPETKANILAEKDVPPGDDAGWEAGVYKIMAEGAPAMFPIEYPINYEPEPENNFTNLASAAGKTLQEFVYDFLTSGDGDLFAILLLSNYTDGNFYPIEVMLEHPNTTIGLSDAGAHVSFIFDAVNPTYQLMHWVRDRSRGKRLPIELMVRKQTKANADLFGLHDRGSIEVGKLADINVFDLNRLDLNRLKFANDLPDGGSRILQSATGYIATFVHGVQTRSNDKDTGRRPGRVIRA